MFVPGDGDRTSDCTCTNVALPIGLLALEVHMLRTGTSSDDDRVSRLRLLVFLMLTPMLEGTGRKVDTRSSFSDDRCAEPEGLCAEFVH